MCKAQSSDQIRESMPASPRSGRTTIDSLSIDTWAVMRHSASIDQLVVRDNIQCHPLTMTNNTTTIVHLTFLPLQWIMREKYEQSMLRKRERDGLYTVDGLCGQPSYECIFTIEKDELQCGFSMPHMVKDFSYINHDGLWCGRVSGSPLSERDNGNIGVRRERQETEEHARLGREELAVENVSYCERSVGLIVMHLGMEVWLACAQLLAVKFQFNACSSVKLGKNRLRKDKVQICQICNEKSKDVLKIYLK